MWMDTWTASNGLMLLALLEGKNSLSAQTVGSYLHLWTHPCSRASLQAPLIYGAFEDNYPASISIFFLFYLLLPADGMYKYGPLNTGDRMTEVAKVVSRRREIG